ncbi:MAG: YfhO family protein [Lachnospiraceae bacterium]|nr:YfhO family protein [Lachnospiraceae bacterium]MDD3616190.1 YfhO family protein [Lachnospiraceae bacterium]
MKKKTLLLKNYFFDYLSDKKSAPHFYLILLIVTNIIFITLYATFIFGNGTYMYNDIGSDTSAMSYPFNIFLSKLLHSGKFSPYALGVGLGTDILPTLLQYVNPINFLLLLFTENTFPAALLIVTFLKLNIISIFSYKYFNLIFKYRPVSIICAWIWTFSSYIILWGQHYSFCTAAMLFTLFLYFLHRYLTLTQSKSVVFFIPVMTIFIFTNYYFFYMTGIISVLYLLFVLIRSHKSIREIAQKLIGLAGMALLSMGIAGITLIPTINSFTRSARTNAITTQNMFSYFKPHNIQTLLSTLARFFSNNMLGTGSNYSGMMNYYEIGMYFTSSLFLFSAIYLVFRKKYRKTTAALLIISLLSVIFPFTGWLFTFNVAAQRWTFIICLLEVLTIGCFLFDIFTQPSKIAIKRTLILSPIIYTVSFLCLFYGHKHNWFYINKTTLALSLGFVGLYWILLLLFLLKYHTRYFLIPFIGILICELVLMNYTSINRRPYITKEELAHDIYNDGSKEAVAEINSVDSDLYRVSKTYFSHSYNDAMVQDYNGLSIYTSVNSSNLIQLKNNYDAFGYSGNSFYIDYSQYMLATLLGTRYVISDSVPAMDSRLYTKVANVGTKEIYKNNYALPFGYLYQNQLSTTEFSTMTDTEKQLNSSIGFYYTNEASPKSETAYPSAKLPVASAKSDLLNEITNANFCEHTFVDQKLTLSAVGADPYITMEDSSKFSNSGTNYFVISSDGSSSEAIALALYVTTDSNPEFSDALVYNISLSQGNPNYSLLLPANITGLRLDLPNETSSINLTEMSVLHYEDENLMDTLLSDLSQSPVTDVLFKDSTYQATVNASSTSMMCIPLIYDDQWSASIDGKPTSLYNINSGLCGVEIPSGKHKVVLKYTPAHFTAGAMTTTVSLLLYFYLFRHQFKQAGLLIKKKLKKSKKETSNA